MTPEQLADGCVEHGVGDAIPNSQGEFMYSAVRGQVAGLTAKQFINDGRVVLAMMGLVPHDIRVHPYEEGYWATVTAYSPGSDEEADPLYFHGQDPNSRGPAIIEACLQAPKIKRGE